jgi:signal peptidase I
MKLPESASTALYIVFGVVLALAINFGLGLALGTDMPVVAVESNSMVPTFYRGDLLILQGAPPEELKIDDIIVFFPEGSSKAIVHRIITINDDGTFQTKGDANARQLPFETSISAGQIHGRRILTIPLLGWVKIGVTEAAAFLMANMLWLAVVIILAAAGGWYILYGRQSRKRRSFRPRKRF